jgi:ribose 5-phosphate isomerase B
MTQPISEAELEALIARVVAETTGGSWQADRLRTIAIGADHRGQELKVDLLDWLADLGYQIQDHSQRPDGSTDYPDIAEAVARQVAVGAAWRGIVIDGAGIGSCMAANKVPGVRAALCYNQATANNARQHNDANVLCLGSSLLDRELARQITAVWLETAFAGGRHARRVDKIGDIERRFSRR